jgi:hypothetical protein
MAHAPGLAVTRGLAAAVGIGAGLAAGAAAAHHSPAAYDLQAVRTVEGTITEYEWGNPHVYLSVREDGSDRVFVVEAFASTAMKSYGWSPQTLAAGDRVVVAGSPGRDAARNVLFLRTLRKAAGGAPLFDAAVALAPVTRPAAAAVRADGLAGTWATLVGPAFTALLPPAVFQIATPRGAAAVAEFSDVTNPGLECVPFSAPLYMVLPGFRSIEVRSDAVVIRGEDAAVERVVHLRVATHEDAAQSIHGHSIGRWEGGALVVDTAQFAPHRLGNGGGLPSSSDKHLVERFALNSEGGLTYTFEVEDAEYLEGRVTGASQWVPRPDVAFAATPCNPSNARRFLAE